MFEDFRLRVFMEVAECRSFTDAAAAMGVTQPAVSQNIAELEKQLGTALFERRRGQVLLTEDGELFKGYAAQILHWYAAATNAFSGKREAEKPLTLPLDEISDAQIWACNGDIHITIKKK